MTYVGDDIKEELKKRDLSIDEYDSPVFLVVLIIAIFFVLMAVYGIGLDNIWGILITLLWAGFIFMFATKSRFLYASVLRIILVMVMISVISFFIMWIAGGSR